MTWEAGLNSKYPALRLIKKCIISVCQWLSDKKKEKRKRKERTMFNNMTWIPFQDH